jgi:hypothetical protein
VNASPGAVIGDYARVEQTFVFQQVQGWASPPRWPVRVGRPPLQAESYLARPALTGRVMDVLSGGETAVLGAATSVIAGDGGTGKTQLAVAIWRALTDGAYGTSVDLAVWVTASSRESIMTGYASAAGRLGLPGPMNDPSLAAQAFLEWLQVGQDRGDGTGRTWLVVLDDVGAPGVLAGLWPQGPSGRVMVTTRSRDAALSGRGRQRVDVDVFTAEEANTYLAAKLTYRSRTPNGVMEQGGDLAAELGFLPLALAQAAAVITNDALTCADYRTLLADKTRTIADLLPQEAGDEHTHSTAAAWSLAVERADHLSPAGLAGRAVVLAAVLDPNGIPETVLTSPAACEFLTPAPKTMVEPCEPVDARRAFRNLHRFSVVAHDPNSSPRTVRMHALAGRATREQASPQVLAAATVAAADALLQTWPSVESDSSLTQSLRDCAAALADVAGDALWSRNRHPVLFRAGQSLGEAGLVAPAVNYWTVVAATAARILGPDHPDSLATRHSLASWLGKAGDPRAARATLEDLLGDCLRVLGADHPDTLTTRHKLASWQGEAGRPAAAAAALAELLSDCLRVLGPDHPITLTTRHKLGTWQGKAGHPEAAAATLALLLEDYLRVLGPDHPDTLTTRHKLGSWRGEAGDAEAAASLLEALLPDCLRALGPDHPITLTTRHKLASWQGMSGRPATAAATLEALLPDCLSILGPDHPDTLTVRHKLASWRGEAGHPDAAVSTLAALLPDCVRVLGPDHPITLTARQKLASWQGEAGRPATAAATLEALLPDCLRVLGPDHPDTLATRSKLAHWRMAAGSAS